jgi:hypothetical protein
MAKQEQENLHHKYRMLRLNTELKNLRLEILSLKRKTYLRLQAILDLLQRNYIAPPNEQRSPAARARGA